MTGSTERSELEPLDEAECRLLLGRHSLGRVVLTSGALPAVVPVGYALVGDLVVVRLSPAWNLRTTLDGAVVAFEVDEIDERSSTGWSIVAVGVAHRLGPVERAAALDAMANGPGLGSGGGLDVDDAAGGIVGIFPTTISGHRVTPGPGAGNRST